MAPRRFGEVYTVRAMELNALSQRIAAIIDGDIASARVAFQDVAESGDAKLQTTAEVVVALQLCEKLFGDSQAMPSNLCRQLGMPERSTYGTGAAAWISANFIGISGFYRHKAHH